MDETQPATAGARQTERMSAWEIALAIVVLAACLIGGLALADLRVPGPAVGVLRFAAEINFESASQVIDLIDAAQRDPSIEALVLELSSPGGYATSSESIYYALLNFRQSKPLVVVVDGLAASGGYYMAAAGNRIYAPASSYVGNVGTRGGRPSDPSLAPSELTSGPYKLEGGSRFEQIHQLDLVANAFVSHVVTQRMHSEVNPLTLTAAEVAEARIYLGSEAVALGLIDGEGGRPEGIRAAAELAGLSDYQVVDVPSYLGLEPIGVSQEPVESAQALLAGAPPGTIFMLDSRIPFPQEVSSPDVALPRKPRTGADYILSGATLSGATLSGVNRRLSTDQTNFAGQLAPAARP